MALKVLTLEGVKHLTDKIVDLLAGKVDKEDGKGLSTNDYTTAEKTKLAGIEASADANVIESVKVNGSALAVSDKSVNVDLSAYALKTDLTAVYRYKGNVATFDALPTEGMTVGDVYNVEDDGSNYAWNGTTWDDLAGVVDLTAYYTKEETDGRYVDLTSQQEITGLKNFKYNPLRKAHVCVGTTAGWVKVADVTMTGANQDSSISFLVKETYGYSTFPIYESGILNVQIRANSAMDALTTVRLGWLVSGNHIVAENFILCHNGMHIELWANMTKGYQGYSFTVLTETGRTSTPGTFWNLYNSSTVEELPSDYTQVVSTYATAHTPSDSADNTEAIATTAWVNLADSVVHTTGNETIAGTKTFTSSPNVTVNNESYVKLTRVCNDNETTYTGYGGVDVANSTERKMRMLCGGTSTRTRGEMIVALGGYSASIGIENRGEGNTYAFAPATRSSGYNSTEIATAGWVDTRIAAYSEAITTDEIDGIFA